MTHRNSPGDPGAGRETGAGSGSGYDVGVARVVMGLERLLESPELVGGRRWALLANQAAVTPGLVPAREALLAAGVGPLVRLFAPEHGLDGVAQDMEAVQDERDPLTGVPVRSLYGTSEATLAPTAEDLEDVDLLVIDLPDIGARHYTFAATMDLAMGACARAGVEVMVLDRPNPIGGVLREGGLVHPGFHSFVSHLDVPVRHGLTLGELAILSQRERHPDLQLTTLACRGWSRAMGWAETGLPWVPPSPNMPTVTTALLYPGLCLVEATTLSEGRGTTTPFHLVGAPGIDPFELAGALRRLELPGLGFRPARFRPRFGKHGGRVCGGVEIHVLEPEAVRPVAAGVLLVATVHELFPERFGWRDQPYEFVSEVPAMDLLTGSPAVREALSRGGMLEPIFEAWDAEVRAFESRLEGVLLYP